MIVYCYTNKINNKKYIGITSRSLEEREKSHLYEAYNNKSLIYEVPFKRAIRKYGIENFTKEILCYCDSFEEACEKERYYIEKYKTYYKYKNSNGYNATIGGELIICPKDKVYQIDPFSYQTVCIFNSVAQAEKEYGRGIFEHCKNMNKKGTPFGFCWYFESDFMSLTKEELKYHIDCIRFEKIARLTTNGDLIDIWNNMREASKSLGISQGNISMVCNRKRCSANGYVFMFYKEYLDNGFVMKQDNQDRSKCVLQMDLDNNIIAKYKSLTEASIKTNTNLTSISNVCKGKRKTAGGYKWCMK